MNINEKFTSKIAPEISTDGMFPRFFWNEKYNTFSFLHKEGNFYFADLYTTNGVLIKRLIDSSEKSCFNPFQSFSSEEGIIWNRPALTIIS